MCADAMNQAAAQAVDAPPAVTLPTVSVEEQQPAPSSDYKVDQPSMSIPKLTQPLIETPQSITIIPRQLMQDQGVTTLRDALRNVTGISLNVGEAGRQGDGITIRGFTASNDYFVDGMNDFGSYYRDPFNAEQIEVLTGPSSVLFGRGSTGGVINQSSKTPVLGDYNFGTVTLGTNLTKRVTADVNTPVPSLGQGAAFRINFMAQNNYYTDRDVAENSRFGIAPSLSFGLGTDTRTTFSYFHQTDDNIPDYGLPWMPIAGTPGNIAYPAKVPRDNFYGFKNNDYLRTNVDMFTAKFEHDFNDTFSFRNQARIAQYKRDFRITEPQIVTAGTTTQIVVGAGTPLSAVTVNRNQIAGSGTEQFMENQSDLTSKFKTFDLDHTLVTGVAIGRQYSNPTRVSYTGVTQTNLLSPDPDQNLNASPARATSQIGATAYTQAVYAIDTLKLNEHWDILGAVRYDRFQSNVHQNINNTTATTLQPVFQASHVDEMPSYRAAVVYKPARNATMYVQYGTSFNPSTEAISSASFANINLEPEKNETFEVGSKWDLLGERLSLNGALFHIKKMNAREADPNNTLFQVLAGTIEVEGLSLGGSGKLTEEWQVFAGYTYLQGEVTSSPASDKGNRPANTPRNSFSLWTTYDITTRLQVGGGVNFVDDRYASSTRDALGFRRVAPAYWTGQAMAKYKVTEDVNVQLNIYNITDEYYYDQVHPSHVVPGEGRTALLTTSFRF
jgi:catecholate siderophore receptor